MEIWKDIEGHDNYQVSTHGRVKRKGYDYMWTNEKGRTRRRKRDEKILTPFPNKKGYLLIDLNDRTYQVHRLVGFAFVDNPDNKQQINHKDNIKTNNCVDNLEWATNQENMTHAQQFKSYEYLKKPIAQIDPITGEIIKIWESTRDARRAGFVGVDKVASDKYPHHKTRKGFKWQYMI